MKIAPAFQTDVQARRAGGPWPDLLRERRKEAALSARKTNRRAGWQNPFCPASAETSAAAGLRLDGRGNVEMAPQEDWMEMSGQIRRGKDSGYSERVARWFLDDPITRPLDPF